MSEELLERIESRPNVMLGKPVIRGTRITVEIILEKLAAGFSPADILEHYPHLSREDVLAAGYYVASVVELPELPPLPSYKDRGPLVDVADRDALYDAMEGR